MYRFKSIRENLSMTQDQVAEKLGITRAAYTNIENGKRDPDTNALIALAGIFHSSVDYLLGLTDIASSQAVTLNDHDEINLIEIFRQLNPTGKSLLMKNARSLIETAEMRQEEHISSMA